MTYVTIVRGFNLMRGIVNYYVPLLCVTVSSLVPLPNVVLYKNPVYSVVITCPDISFFVWRFKYYLQLNFVF